MLEKVFHLLTGYAQFEITGDSARFLNVTTKSGLGFWNFTKRENRACVTCRARDYRRLLPFARRCKVRLHCVKKGGMPFAMWKLWRRKGLLIGAACGTALYLFLSGFVWGVTVSGTELLTDKQVLQAARENGVYVGALKSGFAPKLTAHKLISDLPQLKWASVNTDGCFAEVAVGEKAEKPEINDDLKWSNIVAVREGTILSIEAERGRPEIALGDTVEKGDLLISGLYQERLDPWTPPPKDPVETLGAARGSVVAETYREFTVQVSADKKERLPNGEKQVNSVLHCFGLAVPLGWNSIPEEECRSYRQDSVLTALDTPLPLWIERTVYEFLAETSRPLNEEELKEEALRKLREAQKTALPAGSKILKEELTYSFPDGMCILSAQCRCEEEIGEVREILVNETEIVEDF
ncbi:MAG: sporulation protein YqfD [Acutalibacter sp.]|nr:sporulation protein YqfD [Acutalibacter sp.]